MADELGFMINQAYRGKIPSQAVRRRLMHQAKNLVKHRLMRHFSSRRPAPETASARRRRLGVGRKPTTTDYISPFHLGPLGCRM